METALILFGKPSNAGEVNTRLCPPLSLQEAAQLNGAFLSDAISLSGSVPADPRVYLSGPPAPMDDFVKEWLPQKGNNLGTRMLNAFADTFARGYERVLAIGSDLPTLPAAFLTHAIEELSAHNTVVMGPALDGGYYLIGMTDLHPELFEDLSYSHEQVFAEAMERATTLDVRISVLPRWYDMDTVQDLARLRQELDGLPSSVAPATRAVMTTLRF